MSPGEFYTKLTNVLLLCNGWMTSGPRSIQHNAEVGGVWTSLHQLGMAQDCVLQDPKGNIPNVTRPRMYMGKWTHIPFTYGELFEAMCDRVALLAIDEGDHYHVQPKRP